MDDKIITYFTGEDYFKDGNSIFINYAYEQVEQHVHSHNFIEIAYVASGSGIHIIDGKEYPVGKGDLFLINYDIPHEFRSLSLPSSPTLQVYNCVFRPDFLDITLSNRKDFTDVITYLSFRSLFPWEIESFDDIKLLGIDSSDIEYIYEKMYKEYNEKKEGYIELLKLYVNELVIIVFRDFKKSSETHGSMITNHSKLIEKAIRYLKENYCNNSRLSSLANMSFLSPNYFSKLFKEHTGLTVSEYLQKIRIDEACRKLKQTETKIIFISQEVGYKDLKRFNEVFKKLIGVPPSVYRKEQRKSLKI